MVAHPPTLGYRAKQTGKSAIIRKAAKLKQEQKPEPVIGFLKRLYSGGRLTAGELATGSASARDPGGKGSKLLTRLARNQPRQRDRSPSTGSEQKDRPDTHNCSRGVLRALAKDCVLPPPLRLDIPLWDQSKGKQVLAPVAFQPVHEVLDALVKPGTEDDD